MENNNYFTLEQMINMIDEPNRSICLKIFLDNEKLFKTVQGSTNNHQNWPGGYFDHIEDAMNIAILEYNVLKTTGRLMPFSLSDLLLVVYLHDIEKPWKYELVDGKIRYKSTMQNKSDHQEFRQKKLIEYGIIFTPIQENAMKYAEGEASDYSKEHRAMGFLASVVHVCDVLSSRLWSDYPLKENDPWAGAKRK